jgi:hypothetical protein
MLNTVASTADQKPTAFVDGEMLLTMHNSDLRPTSRRSDAFPPMNQQAPEVPEEQHFPSGISSERRGRATEFFDGGRGILRVATAGRW